MATLLATLFDITSMVCEASENIKTSTSTREGGTSCCGIETLYFCWVHPVGVCPSVKCLFVHIILLVPASYLWFSHAEYFLRVRKQ